MTLDRRLLPEENLEGVSEEHRKKVSAIILGDGMVYSDEVREKLRGAEACVW